jgi:chaperonin GroEL
MKKVYTPEETKRFLLNGMKVIHDIAVDTMGPYGKLILINEHGNVSFSKDGARVTSSLNNLDSLNDIEKCGASLMIEASKKMSEISGDGSTTVVKLSYEICKACISLLTSFRSRDIQQTLVEFRDESIKALDSIKKSIDIDGIKKIATISSNNNEEIGSLVHELIKTLGSQGVFLVEQSYDNQNRIEIKKGFSLDNGPTSEHFFQRLKQDNTMKITMDKPIILTMKGSFSNLGLYIPLLENASKNQHNLVIIADDFSQEAIASITLNVTRGILKCVLIKTPGYGSDKEHMLEDLAIFVGSTILSEPDLSSGITSLDMNYFGGCDKITITPKGTIISEGHNDHNLLQSRIEYLKSKYENTQSSYEKEMISKRIARLSCGIGTLYAENKFMKELIEDAIQASIKSLKEGVVPGCGVDFLHIRYIIDQKPRNNVFVALSNTLESVYKQVLSNAQLPVDLLIHETKQANFQLVPNALNSRMVSKDEIINPYVTTKEAINISIDTAIKFVISSYGVCHTEDKKDSNNNGIEY